MHTLFGERLRKEREKKGLTAEKFAKACGVSRSYITLIENGQRLPGKKNIAKIAVVLNIKTEIVLNWYLEDIAQKIQKDLKS
jgi:transcriptional regulator with XRE-family HTH domain